MSEDENLEIELDACGSKGQVTGPALPDEMFCDHFRHILQRQYLLSGIDPDGFFRHSENNTRLLILGDGVSARLFHVQQALGTVLSHAGHQDPNGVFPGVPRDGIE